MSALPALTRRVSCILPPGQLDQHEYTSRLTVRLAGVSSLKTASEGITPRASISPSSGPMFMGAKRASFGRSRTTCSASTTLAASRQLFWPVPITWIDINNIDACGWCGRRKRRPQRCGKRAASAGHAGTTARARFPRRWHDPQAARIPDGWGVQEVGRRRTRGNSGPGARPRGAGDGGDVRRDLSVR